MKLHKKNRIELVAADSHRQSISQPYLSGEMLIATDGRAMVVLPVVREDGDVDGYVTADALEAARKIGHKNDDAKIHANGAYTFANGATLPRDAMLKDMTFPNWRQVVPKHDAAFPRHRVTLSIDYLTRIAKALNAESLTLEIAGENDAVMIRGGQVADAFAVLMPVRTK